VTLEIASLEFLVQQFPDGQRVDREWEIDQTDKFIAGN